MDFDVIKETLEIESPIETLNSDFRKYIEQVFSTNFLTKLDRVFKKPLIIDSFKEDGNVMAMTTGDNISVNMKMFKELNSKRAMVYIVHELFHVLQNMKQFPEVKSLNRMIGSKTMEAVNPKNINEFLTGKPQNIHSNYKEEFLSYCSNFAFKWSIAPSLKQVYYSLLKNSGLFNMDSDWWKKRFARP